MSRFLLIRVNDECGEATVFATERFKRRSWLWRMDVLKDVLGELQQLYDDAYEQWLLEDSSPRGDAVRAQLGHARAD